LRDNPQLTRGNAAAAGTLATTSERKYTLGAVGAKAQAPGASLCWPRRAESKPWLYENRGRQDHVESAI